MNPIDQIGFDITNQMSITGAADTGKKGTQQQIQQASLGKDTDRFELPNRDTKKQTSPRIQPGLPRGRRRSGW